MTRMDFNLLAAYWSLKKLPGEGLPEIAQEALERGLDSASLRILAGEQNATVVEQGRLFERILAELNIEIPTQSEAVMRIVYHQAQNIVTGMVSSVEGAERISALAYEVIDLTNRLSVFVVLADDYDEFSGEYQKRQHGEEFCRKAVMKIEEQIIEEAKHLVAEKA